MIIKLKASLMAVCTLLLCIVGTAHARSNVISDSEMQNAYQRLVVSKPKQRISANHRQQSRLQSRLQNNHVRNRVIKTAKQQLRKKYRWGGANPTRGFDCSGLVQYAFKSANIHLPRTAAQQYGSTKRVSIAHLQTGDLIFFNTRRRSRSHINHVGIYMGGGNFIHAPRRGKRVSVGKLGKYWKRRIIGAGRV